MNIQKLKQALASSSTAARPGAAKHSRAATADRIAEMTRNRNQSGTSSNGEDFLEDSNSSWSTGSGTNLNAAPKPSKKRRSTETEESPDEKRRKFLERNR